LETFNQFQAHSLALVLELAPSFQRHAHEHGVGEEKLSQFKGESTSVVKAGWSLHIWKISNMEKEKQ